MLFSSEDVTIVSNGNPIVIPSQRNPLLSGLPLICGLMPDTLEPNVNYTTRWIVPAGETITSTQGRFVFTESRLSLNSIGEVPGTILVVTQLSYQDAGNYTCEGRSTAPGASTLWASATFELQLNCELNTNQYNNSNLYHGLYIIIITYSRTAIQYKLSSS